MECSARARFEGPAGQQLVELRIDPGVFCYMAALVRQQQSLDYVDLLFLLPHSSLEFLRIVANQFEKFFIASFADGRADLRDPVLGLR